MFLECEKLILDTYILKFPEVPPEPSVFLFPYLFIYKGLTSNANNARNYARPKTTTQVPTPHLAPVPLSEHIENSWHLVVAASATVLS